MSQIESSLPSEQVPPPVQRKPDTTQGMAPVNIVETIQEDLQEDGVDAMPSQVENDNTLSGNNVSLGGYLTDQQEDDARNSDHGGHDSTQDAQDDAKDQ